jgi:hypothetical protein
VRLREEGHNKYGCLPHQPAGAFIVFFCLHGGMVRSRASSAKNDSSKEFEATFSKQFGQKWPSVKKALLQPSQLVAMENMFTGHSIMGNGDFVPFQHSARGASGGFPLAFL